MIPQNVIICGVVKNVEHRIENNIQCALETGSMFEKCKVIVYENNSTDNTKEILNRYASHTNVKIISENLEGHDKKENNKIWACCNHSCRVEHICNARNKLVDEFNKPEYDEFTYVIMIDFDSNGWDKSGIAHSFSVSSEWDAVFANSKPNYYDFYALRTHFLPFGPEVINETFWSNLPRSHQFENGLIPVFSAFNGIGIYKKDIFKKYRYDCIVNDDVKQFYRNYLKNNSVSDALMKDITAKCTYPYGGYKDEESDIYWKSNSGYCGALVCEHVPLHFALYNNGYKLFINPKLIYHN
jgi:hypothetical protein